jgi:hypothetical protein
MYRPLLLFNKGMIDDLDYRSFAGRGKHISTMYLADFASGLICRAKEHLALQSKCNPTGKNGPLTRPGQCPNRRSIFTLPERT